MKKILYTIAIIALAAGCSLNEIPESFVDRDTFYKTESQCNAALNGCYIPLKSIYNYTMGIATEGCTDLLWIASGTQDAQLDISPAVPRHGATVWKQGYIGVRNCNTTIACIEKSSLSDEYKSQALGEAYVLRAYYYYVLTCFFGDVPFYTFDLDTIELLNEVQGYGRMPASDTRQYLIKELQRSMPLLPQKRTSDVDGNRLGAACGWMLIAKMALWEKEWETALDALKEIEKIYGEFNEERYPLEDVKFRYKNVPESIMEIQHTYSLGGLNYTSNFACICMPYPRQTGTSQFDGVEISEIGSNATAWVGLHPNLYFCQGLMPKSSKDRRKDMTMVWSYNGKQFTHAGTYPWMGPKFWCPDLQGTADGNNYKIFRYADAILMMAECYCELQDYTTSIEYLNKVRERAGTDPYTFRSEVRLRDEIRKERGRELVGEFQRKFDLVRWGIWYQETYDNTSYQDLKNNILPCHEYYPIPDVQVTYSGGALDNKAYEAAGL